MNNTYVTTQLYAGFKERCKFQSFLGKIPLYLLSRRVWAGQNSEQGSETGGRILATCPTQQLAVRVAERQFLRNVSTFIQMCTYSTHSKNYEKIQSVYDITFILSCTSMSDSSQKDRSKERVEENMLSLNSADCPYPCPYHPATRQEGERDLSALRVVNPSCPASSFHEYNHTDNCALVAH